jgi:hypothetical protein
VRRSWRLNERHYGALQGLDKAETLEKYGAEQFQLWRRSFDVPPPPLPDDAEWSQVGDPRYANLADDELPRTECLKDVIARMLPYWESDIIPDLATGQTVLVTAHGNSLRALVKHLDGISDEDIAELNIPTGIPLVYELATTTCRSSPAGTSTPRRPPPAPRPWPRRARSSAAHDEGRGMSHPAPFAFGSAGPAQAADDFSGSQSPVARYCTIFAIATAWSANRSWYRLASVASTVSTASPFHFSPSTLSNTERCSASTLSSSLRMSSAICTSSLRRSAVSFSAISTSRAPISANVDRSDFGTTLSGKR